MSSSALNVMSKRLNKYLMPNKSFSLHLLYARHASTKVKNHAKTKYFLRNDAPPHRVGVIKGWDSKHTGGIEGSLWAHDRFIDDLIIRKFIEGTFYDLLFSDVIVKRTLNQITISIYVQAKGPTVHKVYFLLGFSEKLLSHMLGCVVKMEIMSVQL